ncbi:MAG TPA: hypothetical protein VEH05_05610, partial [Streptosporangiaceae bacterium]|nr:hypothetical protein [Streptosporangiaceae bacterium]
MTDQDQAEQLRRAAEALSAARHAARARGARPAPRTRTAAPDQAAAPGQRPDSWPIATVEPTMAAVRQGNAPGGESVISEEIKPEAAPPAALEAAATGRRRRAGARAARAQARPGFAPEPEHADPAPLSAAIGDLLDAEGWGLSVATGSVFGRWA